MTAKSEGMKLVIDTNIALDLLVFQDEKCAGLLQDLHEGRAHWLATQVMRDELERVLAYKTVAPRMEWHGLQAEQVLATFDQIASLHETPQKVAIDCKDVDDQKFIDLAAAHGAMLLSKDRQVLKCKKRLQKYGADISSVYQTAQLQEELP